MKELVEEMPDEGYGCTVANRFGQLLGDESDPFDILYAAGTEKKQKKKKEEPKKTSTTTKSGKKESQRDRKTILPAGGGGQVRPGREDVEERIQKRVTFDRKFNDAEKTPLSFSVERPVDVLDRPARGRGTGRGRGARGPGFPRSNDGFDQRGKREFERHSGSDRSRSVRSEEKRSGSGSRNWGSMRDHMSVIEVALPSEEVTENEETQEAVETDGENRPSETEEVIEVAIEMTLDEWKALQEQSRPKVELNIRKTESSVPSKAVVIHKSKFLQKQDGMDEDVVFRRPANDITCQLEFNFGSLDRSTRGGRGGRGGRGRGAPFMPTLRSPQKFDSAPNPDDPEDFPALA
ncbi:intracellular hyaluronan-binding protein 4 isoform X1 [Danio aesculapii]|uniref:intracellular hyaluronan-binding protein 4 isoform X1 n=1 Tax=Danio aesculapii TaxID=1142201 RepID=UPI0024BF887D|nr:intracellular hyaluronan-binding protein 4 isoform X1 [Danio aesculapii]